MDSFSTIVLNYPFISFFSFVLVLIPLSFYVSIRRKYRKDIAAGEFSWFLGHFPFFLKNNGRINDAFYESLSAIYDQTKSLNSITYFPFDVSIVATSDPKNIEHILKTNFENYIKGPEFFKKQEILLGHGIFNVDGEAWKRQRKSASLIFNVKNFRDFMMQVFIEHAQTLCDKLNEAVQQESIIDLYDLLLRFTLDAFMEIGMGCHLNSLKQETQSPFAIAFDRAQTIVALRFTKPNFIWNIQERLDGTRNELHRCMNLVNSFADNIIEDRKKQELSEENLDLLSKFLNPKYFDEQVSVHKNKDLRDIIINFIIAGRDTTAQALSWCFFLLCQNPKVLKKLRKEIETVCGYSMEGLNYQNVKSLTYAQDVLKEALRLYPSVPKEIKYAFKDDVWPDGTKITAGQGISWIPYAMGRLQFLWGPDALEFKPERWNVQPQPTAYQYPVFNAGPRVCLGQQMALLEGTFCLAKLVQSYDFELVNPNEVTYNEGLTMQMKNGLRVRVKYCN